MNSEESIEVNTEEVKDEKISPIKKIMKKIGLPTATLASVLPFIPGNIKNSPDNKAPSHNKPVSAESMRAEKKFVVRSPRWLEEKHAVSTGGTRKDIYTFEEGVPGFAKGFPPVVIFKYDANRKLVSVVPEFFMTSYKESGLGLLKYDYEKAPGLEEESNLIKELEHAVETVYLQSITLDKLKLQSEESNDKEISFLKKDMVSRINFIRQKYGEILGDGMDEIMRKIA